MKSRNLTQLLAKDKLFQSLIKHLQCKISLTNSTVCTTHSHHLLSIGTFVCTTHSHHLLVLFCPRPVSYFIEFTLFGNERKIFHIKFLFMYITLLYRAGILS
jgi:hypothetical protein